MIVKLIIHKKFDAISIWNENGDRLYHSDKAGDIETAKKLLAIQKAKTDKDLAQEMIEGKPAAPVFEQAMNGYFGAMWMKGKVQLQKRVSGYVW